MRSRGEYTVHNNHLTGQHAKVLLRCSWAFQYDETKAFIDSDCQIGHPEMLLGTYNESPGL